MAYVVSVLNQKGGVGKSTLSTNLATYYARLGRSSGKPAPDSVPGSEGAAKNLFKGAEEDSSAEHSDPMRVLLADGDSQGTARNWRSTGPNESEEAFPDVVGADTAESIETLTDPEVAEAFDAIVIDGPPGAQQGGPGDVTVAALKAADLVLIPARPSGADLWATSDLADLVSARRDATGSPNAAFVVTQADPRTNVAGEISGALEELGIPALDARCGFRVAYTKAMGKGVSVMDMEPSGKAAAEIEAIAQEIRIRFHD
jgi:ATPases involved in chromosome partitioning